MAGYGLGIADERRRSSFGTIRVRSGEPGPDAARPGARSRRHQLRRQDEAHREAAALSAANLERSDFAGATLQAANLTGANLLKADLAGTRFCQTVMPDGSEDNSGC